MNNLISKAHSKSGTLRLFVILLATGICINANAKNYSVKKGSSITVNCTATAPGNGWITHAFFSLVDPQDQEYLGIYYQSSDLKATFYGLKTRSNIKIEVTYAYSYRGSYDNDIHVGHGSYYDYITVTGAPDATSIEFRERNSISILPGKSVVLHVDLKPKGADGSVSWGFVSGFGKPFCFDLNIASDGLSAVVTAKKEGTAYLLAMVDNDQKRSCVITLNCTNNAEAPEPTYIEICPSELNLTIGRTSVLTPSFTPQESASELTWSSSNPEVAAINNTGTVTAIAGGTATITASSPTGITGTATVNVLDNMDSFDVPASITVNLGFNYTIMPKIYPSGAVSDITWSTSSSKIAKVSSSGVITAIAEGTCTITAKSKALNLSKTIEVTISRPSSTNIDHRNIRQRIQAVKALVTRSSIK